MADRVPEVDPQALTREVHQLGHMTSQLVWCELTRILGGDPMEAGHERLAPSVEPLPAVLEPDPTGEGP